MYLCLHLLSILLFRDDDGFKLTPKTAKIDKATLRKKAN
jgi:hypothetical protein